MKIVFEALQDKTWYMTSYDLAHFSTRVFVGIGPKSCNLNAEVTASTTTYMEQSGMYFSAVVWSKIALLDQYLSLIHI